MWKDRYFALLEKIRCTQSQSPFGQQVTCIVVTKGRSVSDIQSLYDLGQRHFGENYAQELLQKAPLLPPDICWHFLGHLQTNKIKALLPWLGAIHSVDSLHLVDFLGKVAHKIPRPLWLWVQVNFLQKEQQSGLLPDQVEPFFQSLQERPVFSQLQWRGLMTLAGTDPPFKPLFQKLRVLGAKVKPWTAGELSMGMSQDFEEAILEGATHLRIGRWLWAGLTKE